MQSAKATEGRSGRPRRNDKQDRSKHIFDAAVYLIAERGFETTTIQDIAAQANVATSLVTHYFGSKQALIERCNAHVLDELRTAYASALPELASRRGPDAIDAMMSGFVKVFNGRTQLFRYLRRLFVANDVGANLFFREYYELIRSLIDTMEAAGELAPESSKVWITFQFMFLQLGPAFLKDQIESVIGIDVYDPGVANARLTTIAATLKYGIFAPRTRP